MKSLTNKISAWIFFIRAEGWRKLASSSAQDPGWVDKLGRIKGALQGAGDRLQSQRDEGVIGDFLFAYLIDAVDGAETAFDFWREDSGTRSGSLANIRKTAIWAYTRLETPEESLRVLEAVCWGAVEAPHYRTTYFVGLHKFNDMEVGVEFEI